jgi:subtilase family serine protease
MSERDTTIPVIDSAGRPPSRHGKPARRRSARWSIRTGALRTFAVLLVSIAAAIAPAAPAAAASSPVAQAHPAPSSAAVCGAAAPGFARCLSWLRTDIAARARSQVTPLAAPSGYGPASLQSAYHLAAASLNSGAGRTVAVVDAYDQPNAEADLAAYRTQYGLPPCTTANGCFRKVNQGGGTSYPAANSGWGLEIALDLQMVSAICPNCHIFLVEASSASFTNLGAAVNRAVAMGAVAVSNSYGGGDSSSDSSYDSAYYNHPGVAITASSGDSGYGVEYPAASRYVVGVGGTTLSTASNARGWTESAWSGAGSGCSSYESKPTWQTDAGCTKRTVADVSAAADPNTGVAVYDSYGYGGWIVVGGTSVASPIIASTFALAGTPASGSYPASSLYANPGSLYDVTSGSNGSCGGSYLCTGMTGYDGPTGLGTPNGTGAFGSSAPVSNDFSISANPSSVSVTQGTSGTSTISTAVVSGSGTVSLAVTGTPSGATASLSPTSVSVGGSSTLTLTVGSSVATGAYALTVTGTEGSAVHSTTVSLTVTAAAGIPGAPVLTATTNNRRGVQLSWTVPANHGSAISAYRIYRSTSPGSETQLVQVGRTSTSYRDTSTTSGTTYYYEVTAVNGNGEGPRSNEVSAKAR